MRNIGLTILPLLVPTPRDEDLARATQLVDAALEEAMAGQPVSIPTSRPYGCTVKYP